MKKFFKLFVCFCLVASTLCGIWACDDISTDNPSEETTTAATTQNPDDPAQRPGETTGSKPTSKPTSKPESTTEGPRLDYSTRLPNKDWDGKELIVIGNINNLYPQMSNFEIARDQEPDDIVGKAVWQRNNALEAKYNFVVKQDTWVTTSATAVQEAYNKGEDLYDVAFVGTGSGFVLAQQGMFKDMRETQYIDLAHPSWDAYATGQLTISGRTFLSASDLTIQNLDRAFIIYYNRELARTENLGMLEDMVDNDTWTLDNCYDILKKFSDDRGGNGQKGDIDDSFGLALSSQEFSSMFIIGGGFRLTTNEGGNLKFVEADKDDTVKNIIDKVALFAYDRTITLYPEQFGSTDEIWSIPLNTFGQGRALMYSSALSEMNQNFLDIVSFEFGYMPYPKYTSDQDNYYTMTNIWNSTLVGIPATVSEGNLDFVSFALQALTEASTKTTYHAYYETKCKHWDAYDERCAGMLDLIFDNVVYDVGIIYDLGRTKTDKKDGLYSAISYNLPILGENTYMNIYERNAENAKGQLQDIIDDFADLD